jgi:ribosomal protein S18 acetylase RimI-like enzyme
VTSEPTYRIRDARGDDHPHFVRLQGYLGHDLTALDEDRWTRTLAPHAFFVETEGGEVAGYGLCFAFGERGDVRQLSVEPSWRRRGLGRQMLREMATRLRAAGCRDWGLEVDGGNAPARALYRSVGMQVVGEQKYFRAAPSGLARALGPASTRFVLEVARAEEHAAIEARFALLPGKMARLREVRPNATAWILREAPSGSMLGLVRLTPDLAPELGLVFPLRADDEDAARALLSLALSRAPDLPPTLELCAQDEVVAAALGAAGATLHATALEMRGPLPDQN